MTPTAIPDEAARSRTLLFLTNPKLWPNWPLLALVRRRQGQQEEELGVIFDALGACGLAGFSATVFACNLFLLPRSLDLFLALPHETFDVPEEVCAAGWNVD
jgi:hypothetical protein